MKKQTKNGAELNDTLVSLLDTIDDEYLDEALSLHVKASEPPKRAGVFSLFSRRIAPIAACLLIVAALAPLAFILSMTLGGGCGSVDHEGSAPPENSGPDGFLSDSLFPEADDTWSYVLFVGRSATIVSESGSEITVTFSSYDNGVFTLEIDAVLEKTPNIFVYAPMGGWIEHSHNSIDGYPPPTVEDGFAVGINVGEGVTLLTLDTTAFSEKTGVPSDNIHARVIFDGYDCWLHLQH